MPPARQADVKVEAFAVVEVDHVAGGRPERAPDQPGKRIGGCDGFGGLEDGNAGPFEKGAELGDYDTGGEDDRLDAVGDPIRGAGRQEVASTAGQLADDVEHPDWRRIRISHVFRP